MSFICEAMPGRQPILPLRATGGSAGFDLYLPHDSTPIIIYPRSQVSIPLGFKAAFPPSAVGMLRIRSSLANQHRLRVVGGDIDSDYRGEWICMVANDHHSSFTIQPGQRFAHVLFLALDRIYEAKWGRVSETERGEGGFGSTGQFDSKIVHATACL